MSKRTDLISQITTNLAAHTNFSVSQELPFISGGIPLYDKNMRTIYVDEQQIEVGELYDTLDGQTINQTTTTIMAYMSLDAKEQLTDIDTVVANLLLARNGIANTIESTSEYETDIVNDVITYTFEYNFTTV
jgi:hypothetical protein